MQHLNFHHLSYFWHVAHEGGVSAASRALGVSQPTISAQVKLLEESLGVSLFERRGRSIALTTAGQVVLRYADEIIGLGRELVDVADGMVSHRPIRLRIGCALVVPKMIVERLIRPALALSSPIELECVEDRVERLVDRLAAHSLDLVLSDAPLSAASKVKAFTHPLGSSSIDWCAAPDLARSLTEDFPASMTSAPVLLPTRQSALRRDLDQWFALNRVRPRVVGEFDDSALAKVFAMTQRGAVAIPAVITAEVCRMYGLERFGSAASVQERLFAITMDRKLTHPGVVAISTGARVNLEPIA